MNEKMPIQCVMDEHGQGHPVRKHLYEELQSKFGMPIISYFTSFVYPFAISDQDADMLENILQTIDASKGFLLLVNSPGGSGLAAERIIKVCRTYSKGCFYTAVPRMAKSAATMICLGSNKIYMGHTSELGPIDPQVVVTIGEDRRLMPVQALIQSYNDLMAQALEKREPIEIFLLQLSKFDAREIEMYKRENELTKDIMIKSLKTGMLSELSEDAIISATKKFIESTEAQSHGRPIYAKDLLEAGSPLHIELLDLSSEEWKLLWELFVRIDFVLSRLNVGKIVESLDHNYIASFKPKPK